MARVSESSVDTLVIALCLDYARRSRAIFEKSVSKRTDTEFRYLNFKIYDAAAEISGDENAEIFIEEIGNRLGYAKSKIEDISEVTYKDYKRLIKDNIAKKLHLVD